MKVIEHTGRETFQNLIVQLNELLDDEPRAESPTSKVDADTITLMAAVQWNDDQFVLVYLPDADPDHFCVYCPLEEWDDADAAVLARALRANALFNPADQLQFCLHPVGSFLALRVRMVLPLTGTQELISQFAELERLHALWRHTRDDSWLKLKEMTI